MTQVLPTVISLRPQGATLFGQPRGLATLFLTEMWERFTYYGMRAILILFMTAKITEGGLGVDDRTASSLYGLYIGGTYVLSLAGGWIADRLIGAQRAVISGGALITLGNVTLIACNARTFIPGLCAISLGVGLLKPNISALVAQLYPEGGARRDAGFSVFYMGINLGAFFGALLVPLCTAYLGWHWGFALPAIGMLFGLAQFVLTRSNLGSSGSGVTAEHVDGSWLPIVVLLVVVVATAGLFITGIVRIDPRALSSALSSSIAVLAAGYFIHMAFFSGLTPTERSRVYVMVALFAASAVFLAGIEQSGASFNLFAERYTKLTLFGWQMPAGVLQATSALFTILFAPLFAALWLSLGRRGKDPAPSTKFAAGLALMGCGFLVMYVASRFVIAGSKVLPTWLILTYLLHEFGDLCLSPVGLSSMTKLAPKRYVGQAMGLWFLSIALGNNFAGQLSREYDASDLLSLPGLFLKVFWYALGASTVLLIFTPALKRLMRGVN